MSLANVTYNGTVKLQRFAGFKDVFLLQAEDGQLLSCEDRLQCAFRSSDVDAPSCAFRLKELAELGHVAFEPVRFPGEFFALDIGQEPIIRHIASIPAPRSKAPWVVEPSSGGCAKGVNCISHFPSSSHKKRSHADVDPKTLMLHCTEMKVILGSVLLIAVLCLGLAPFLPLVDKEDTPMWLQYIWEADAREEEVPTLPKDRSKPWFNYLS